MDVGLLNLANTPLLALRILRRSQSPAFGSCLTRSRLLNPPLTHLSYGLI